MRQEMPKASLVFALVVSLVFMATCIADQYTTDWRWENNENSNRPLFATPEHHH